MSLIRRNFGNRCPDRTENWAARTTKYALATEIAMIVAIYICSAAVLTVMGIGLYDLESWLERWDYDRHHED
jgi:hypothetical protein